MNEYCNEMQQIQKEAAHHNLSKGSLNPVYFF